MRNAMEIKCSNIMNAIGWRNDCEQIKLSHKPIVAGLDCGEAQYDKRNTIFFAIDIL